MARTALVTGATGLLGRQVMKAFERGGWVVKGTGLTRAKPPAILKLDLESETDVAKVLREVKPSVVVHCAANRFPDKCDKDPEGTRALNVAASASLARLCSSQDILLIYISTDYVFPGTEGEAPYEVTDTPHPPNLYGETKYEGERAVLGTYGHAGRSSGWAVVLRVPVLYGEAETPEESAVNVLMNSVWKAQEKDAEVAMDHWAIRYPTNTEDVGRVCLDIAVKYLETADKYSLPRILQFSSEDRLTKYEICEIFAEIMGLPLDGMKPNTQGNDPNASVKRPYDCHLSTLVLKELDINVATMNFKDWWRREMRAYRK
ncbi:putative Methionine adenosyltransferase 2 subunit beta [Venustampulla echinocandica]|uniref:Putative Methionine adenosyltransferase 2 subunit beta n=1 Tax=Venustampulla echinocandica TaxID=2656787 RepID=A0A370TZK2_9HELO|nr:putative Methionine adenosyltransferase 2 subunit beta [Venustampulla echinocandica]RDL40945.1 putative Methionine adenosyltransferase 2 subunit beta [Venustampulla echinocandica]